MIIPMPGRVLATPVRLGKTTAGGIALPDAAVAEDTFQAIVEDWHGDADVPWKEGAGHILVHYMRGAGTPVVEINEDGTREQYLCLHIDEIFTWQPLTDEQLSSITNVAHFS